MPVCWQVPVLGDKRLPKYVPKRVHRPMHIDQRLRKCVRLITCLIQSLWYIVPKLVHMLEQLPELIMPKLVPML